jgi:hypothetical protein
MWRLRFDIAMFCVVTYFAAKLSNVLLTVTFMQCAATYVSILCDTFRGVIQLQ